MSSYSSSSESSASQQEGSVFTDEESGDDDNKIPSLGDLKSSHKHPELGSAFEYRNMLFFNTGKKDTLDLRRVHPIRLERDEIRFYYPILAVRYLVPFVTFETIIELAPLFKCHMPFENKQILMKLLDIHISAQATVKELETKRWSDGDTAVVELVKGDDMNITRMAEKLKGLDQGSKRSIERNLVIVSKEFISMEHIAQAQNLLHSTKNNLMFFYLSK